MDHPLRLKISLDRLANLTPQSSSLCLCSWFGACPSGYRHTQHADRLLLFV